MLGHKGGQRVGDVLAADRASLIGQATGTLGAAEEMAAGKEDHPGLVRQADLAHQAVEHPALLRPPVLHAVTCRQAAGV